MGNDKLRDALETAGITPAELGEQVGVDERTIRRWLAGGSSPYPRYRRKIAKKLDVPEHELFNTAEPATPPPAASEPNLASVPVADGDLLIGHPYTDEGGDLDPARLIRSAHDHILVLDDHAGTLLQIPGVIDALVDQANRRVDVRVLVGPAGPHLRPLLKHPGIECRLSPFAPFQPIIRADDQILLTVCLDYQSAPLASVYVKRHTDGGIYDRLAVECDAKWDEKPEPSNAWEDAQGEFEYYAETDAEADTDEVIGDPRPDAADAAPTDAPATAPGGVHPADPPRRWPGRPD